MTLLGMLVGAGGPAYANADFKTQIVFSRQDPTAGDAHVFIANPNGTGEREVPLRLPGESLGGAFWSPGGTKLLITNVFLPPRPSDQPP